MRAIDQCVTGDEVNEEPQQKEGDGNTIKPVRSEEVVTNDRQQYQRYVNQLVRCCTLSEDAPPVDELFITRG
jgi:hypothetical protein